MSDFAKEKTLGQVVFIKGKITEINHPLLYFQVDGKYRIYVNLTNHLPKFPCENDEVEIINPKKFNEKTGTVLIGPKTKCQFPSVITIEDNQALELFHVLKDNNVDEDELVALDCILRQLEPFYPEHALRKCLISIVCNSPLVMKGLQHVLKYKRSLKQSQIKFPSDFNYVNDTSDLYKFIKFDGMCMYNVYPNRRLHNVTDSCTEYLFGILDVDLMSGNFALSHRTFKILVKFYTTVKSLYMFKNSLVMFKKWTVFTEVFQEKSASSLKYILADVEDVIVIASMININQERLFYPRNELWKSGQRKMMFLQTVRISEVIYGYNKGPECWIQGFISERDHSLSSKRLVSVILTNNHIAIVPFLKEQIVYKIFYDEEPEILKIRAYQEINRLNNSKDLYRIGKDAIFQETDITPVSQNDQLLEKFQDVEKFIKTASQNRMFSLCLRISRKHLQDNSHYALWIPKRHDNAVYFGTPGKNTQARLIFQNSISNAYIDLYLSDRQNHVTPLALIDNMKVKIKHVQVYKNKYIKTNVFSSFEIVEYCPEIMFSSVNLHFSDRSTWHWRNKTPKTLLGMFPYLPEKCIVHGIFLLQAFSFIKITPLCDRCKKPSVAEMPCHSCKIRDRDLNINMRMCAQDSINPTFYMNTENKHLFFELIGIRSSNEIKHFCNAFFNIGEVKVNFCNLEEFRISIKDGPSKIFLDELIKMIRTEVNYNLFPLVDAVCIKHLRTESDQWKIIEFVFM